jgi:hypothetical protein
VAPVGVSLAGPTTDHSLECHRARWQGRCCRFSNSQNIFSHLARPHELTQDDGSAHRTGRRPACLQDAVLSEQFARRLELAIANQFHRIAAAACGRFCSPFECEWAKPSKPLPSSAANQPARQPDRKGHDDANRRANFNVIDRAALMMAPPNAEDARPVARLAAAIALEAFLARSLLLIDFFSCGRSAAGPVANECADFVAAAATSFPLSAQLVSTLAERAAARLAASGRNSRAQPGRQGRRLLALAASRGDRLQALTPGALCSRRFFVAAVLVGGCCCLAFVCFSASPSARPPALGSAPRAARLASPRADAALNLNLEPLRRLRDSICQAN